MKENTVVLNKDMFGDDSELVLHDQIEFEMGLFEYLSGASWNEVGSAELTITGSEIGLFAESDAKLMNVEESIALGELTKEQFLVSLDHGVSKQFLSVNAEDNMLKLLSVRDWFKTSNTARFHKEAIQFINFACSKPESKRLLMRTAFGKIRGVLSHDNYRILDQHVIYQAMNEYILSNYDDSSFARGIIGHDLTFADWKIVDEHSLSNIKKMLGAKNIHSIVQLRNSDTGSSSVKAAVYILADNIQMMLGNVISVSHRGDVSEDTFIDQLDKILSSTKQFEADFGLLEAKAVNNPAHALENVLQGSGVHRKYIRESAERFSLLPNPTRLELYKECNLAIANMAHEEDVSVARIIECQENVSRLLVKSYDWGKVDVGYIR